MQPLSNHWADIAAIRVIKARGDKDQYVLASGITPSGLVHVGNFREVITVDLVARALRKLGKSVRFIYSWDNFDTFRKVPANVPDKDAFVQYLRKPIARIPDPWKNAKSYAHGRMEIFEHELSAVGIAPHFLYQEEKYSRHEYADLIIDALEKKDIIKTVLNEFRTSPLEDDWLPTSVYCSKCQKDEMHHETYEGSGKYSYHCKSCDFKETFLISACSNIKLAWRIDWPMRWHFEGVDFEPGGKDHSSQGGSFDTGSKLIKALWNEEAPTYLQYDFVMIKGGAGKMSSSSGELYTLDQVLEVYEPQIVRWIFANQRPNHDFALAFDEDVIKIYEEFDKAESISYEPVPQNDKNGPLRRAYELSNLEEASSPVKPHRAGFRILCNRLQLCGGNIERTFDRFYKAEFVGADDHENFVSRAQRAWYWLQNYAPADFRYTLNTHRVEKPLAPVLREAIASLRELISKTQLEIIDPKALNEAIWEHVIKKHQIESTDFFRAVYQQLIERDQGPRLPGFLKEIGQERLLELL